MTVSNSQISTEIEYPYTDGQPMAESDQARKYLTYGVEVLEIYFQNREDIYVSGNLFIYYQKGNPKAVVAPDVFVVFGVAKGERLSYKFWEEENKAPDFVLEITSKTTQDKDEQDKPELYARLGVREYFQYDPTGDYLNPQLKGARLVEGKYQSITGITLPDGLFSLSSEALGLELRLLPAGELRFYEPTTGEKLLSHQEEKQARQEAELARREAIPRLLEMGLNVEQIAAALSFPASEVKKVAEEQR